LRSPSKGRLGSLRAVPASAEQLSHGARQPSASVARSGGLGVAGVLAWVIGLFPRRAIPALGGFLAWLAGTVLKIRRPHVERSMKLAGIARSRAGPIATLMYESLGSSLIEMLWLAAHPEVPASAIATIDEYSRAVRGEARERGRGAVLATAHAGNWELAAAALAESYPLTVVVKPMSVGWVERFCRSARLSRGIALATPANALEHARVALGRGELVAMLIDQVPGRASHAVHTDFLCGRADVDRSPAALASYMRAPLVVAVSRRVGGGAHVLEVLAVLHPPQRDRRAWVEEATRTATRVLERWIHAHPYDWLWMHRRWRLAPGTVARRPPGSLVPQAPSPPVAVTRHGDGDASPSPTSPSSPSSERTVQRTNRAL
jgi:KDO2-lipid IV(A) lauroyltransferase